MTINVFLCVNTSISNITCATPEAQKTFFDNNSLTLRILNSYFDPNDVTDPIKHFIDDRIYYPTLYG